MTSLLFAAALLVHGKEMDARVRSSVLSTIAPFDIHSQEETIQVMAETFRRHGIPHNPHVICTDRRLRQAAQVVKQWQKEEVTVVERGAFCRWEASGPDLPPVAFVKGDLSILTLKRLAILSSRGPRRITLHDPWLIAIKDRFRFALPEAEAVVSSLGAPGYEMVNCMAVQQGIPLLLVCNDVLPFMKSAERLAEFLSRYEGMFDPERMLMVSPLPPGGMPSVQERSALRDRLVAASASFIAAAAIREGGNMHTILASAAEAGVPMTVYDPERLDDRFPGNRSLAELSPGVQIHRMHTTCGQSDACNPTVRSSATNSKARRVLRLRNWPGRGYWLTHYTRARSGPWPGQSLAQYYAALAEGREDAGHSGFDTLRRILEEGLIRAGDRFTRGQIPVVSFTECLPAELADLVEWRRGLIRWSFEPYAVAVKKDALLKAGAGPVIYGDEAFFGDLPEPQGLLFQLQRPGGKDWTREKEWRVLGDIKLDTFPSEDVTVIVPTLEEAWVIYETCDFQVTLAGIDWHGSGELVRKSRLPKGDRSRE